MSFVRKFSLKPGFKDLDNSFPVTICISFQIDYLRYFYLQKYARQVQSKIIIFQKRERPSLLGWKQKTLFIWLEAERRVSVLILCSPKHFPQHIKVRHFKWSESDYTAL